MMIDVALKFLRNFLATELVAPRISLLAPDAIRIGFPVKEMEGVDTDDISLTLLHIEEERALRGQYTYIEKERPGETDLRKKTYKALINPEIKLNLYVLISCASKTEGTGRGHVRALQLISEVIKLFQGKNVFEEEDLVIDDDDPGAAINVEYQQLAKLIVEYEPMNLDKAFQLWQTLGTKPLPAALYKVRMLILQDNREVGSTYEIKGIGVDAQRK